MTMQTPATEPQAGTSGAPQAGEGAGSPQPQDGTEAGEPQQPQGGANTAEEGDLPEPVREMLRNYRQENRSLRERLRALEQAGKPQAGEQPQIAELQRTVEAQQARLRSGEVRYAVAVASGKLGIVDPEAAYRLLDPEDIDYDERDKPQNVERLLTDLTRERPWLKATGARGGSDGGAGSTPKTASRSMNDALREATGRGRR